jgi:hypothetical protein
MGMRIASPALGTGARGFAYLADKTFLAACFLYATNRFWGKPHFGDSIPFLRCHFDDCLLVPAALPPLLYVFRKLGLRRDDSPPSLREVAEWTFLWAVTFEWAFPRFLGRGIGDWRDVIAYAVGGLVSWRLWQRGSQPLVAANPPRVQASAKSANILPVRPFSTR